MSETPAIKPEFTLDGRRISSLESFFEEFSRVVLPEHRVRESLDAFNDILRGGLGTQEDGFTLRWLYSAISRENLGYPETVRQLEIRFARCHPSNRDHVWQELTDARAHTGKTVFEWLVEIIRIHGPGGEEAEDNVSLVLE